MILFLGTIEKGYFAEEIALKINEKIEFTGYKAHIEQFVDIATQYSYSHIIVDIEQFIDDVQIIADTLLKIKNVSNANIIIYARGYNVKSEIVKSLSENNFKSFVIDNNLARQKEELERAFNKEDTISERLTPSVNENIINEPVISLSNKQKTVIAISGCCPRMGATTQAIQIIKYLTLKGYSACYIEMNESNFIKTLDRIYTSPDKDEDIGRVTHQNVDMYYKSENIASILKLDYDFYIYDFGAFSDKNFNTIPFLEKDIKIVVCGAFPNEFESMDRVISSTLLKDTKYIFNFCHENEQADILDLMQEKKDSTFFSGYTPDPFTYTSNLNAFYEKIIHVQNVSKKKKLGLFRRNK